MRTSDVNAALRTRFCAPEWAIFFEVADATGSNQRRWADAVALNLYPSRGLEIHGFEVKVSRADWLKELKSPEKSAPVQQYCDRWWIVAPAGIIREGELPPTWGHYEVSDAGKIRQVVAAPKLEAVPVTRAFMAAFLRRAGAVDGEMVNRLVEDRLASYRERDEARITREIENRTRAHEELRKQVQDFEAASGIRIRERWLAGDEIGRAVKLVMETGVSKTYNSVIGLRNSIQSSLKTLDGALKDFESARPEQESVGN